jgi:hypothetical protein
LRVDHSLGEAGVASTRVKASKKASTRTGPFGGSSKALPLLFTDQTLLCRQQREVLPARDVDETPYHSPHTALFPGSEVARTLFILMLRCSDAKPSSIPIVAYQRERGTFLSNPPVSALSFLAREDHPRFRGVSSRQSLAVAKDDSRGNEVDTLCRCVGPSGPSRYFVRLVRLVLPRLASSSCRAYG